jgi:hypothetical protein
MKKGAAAIGGGFVERRASLEQLDLDAADARAGGGIDNGPYHRLCGGAGSVECQEENKPRHG